MWKLKVLSMSSQVEHFDVQDDAPDRPPTFKIAVIVTLSFLVVGCVWFAAYTLLWKSTDILQSRQDPGMGDPVRLDYLKKENALLDGYQKNQDGTYRIPIDRAMQLVVQRSQN